MKAKDIPESASSDAADTLLLPARIESLADGTPVALCPPNWSAQDLSKYLPKREPTFREGTVQLHDLESFAAYVARHSTESTVVYAEHSDNGGGKIVAVIDDGAPKTPGRRVDRAILEISADPRFAAWAHLHGKAINQRGFIDFIEDHDREFLEPGGAHMRTCVNQLEVKKNVTFKNVEREDSAASDVSLIYETDTQQTNELKFPQNIIISVPIMRNCAAVPIHARIRYKVEDGKVTFTVKLESLYVLLEVAWSAVIQELRKLLEKIPVLQGKPA